MLPIIGLILMAIIVFLILLGVTWVPGEAFWPRRSKAKAFCGAKMTNLTGSADYACSRRATHFYLLGGPEARCDHHELPTKEITEDEFICAQIMES